MEDLSRAYQGHQYTTKKKDVSYKVTKWIVFIVFVIYGISLLFPFIWMLISSFKTGEEFDGNIFGFPKEFYGMNFIEVMQYEIGGQTIANMFLMSVLVTVIGTVVNIFFSACAAYVLAKFKFRGRGVIYAVAIFTMIVPIVGTLPAQVQMMQTLHLDGDNAFMGIIFLYSGAFGFNFILLYSSFTSVSSSYLEAASIDGANAFRRFFTVTLPGLKPTFLYILITVFIGACRVLIQPMLLTGYQDRSMTLSYYMYQQGFTYRHVGYSCAVALLLTIVIGSITFIQRKLLGEKKR